MSTMNGVHDSKVAGTPSGGMESLDWDALKRNFAKAATDEARQQLLARVIVELLGEMKEKELPIFDAQGCLFAHLLAPGYRESLRLLEAPQRRDDLNKARAGSFVPAEEILPQLKKAQSGK